MLANELTLQENFHRYMRRISACNFLLTILFTHVWFFSSFTTPCDEKKKKISISNSVFRSFD